MKIAQIENDGLCPSCGAINPRHYEGCPILDALRDKMMRTRRPVKPYEVAAAYRAWMNRGKH